MMSRSDASVYFYCVPSYPKVWDYQHCLIALAEGLQELGIKTYADRNCWRLSTSQEDYLISHQSDVAAQDCSIIILDHASVAYDQPFPQHLFKRDRKYLVVYLDHSDGTVPACWKPEFRQFDFIFKTHFNRKFWYPSNVYPWAFGLSHRIINAIAAQSFEHRKPQILVNFRDKMDMRCSTHSVRRSIYKKVLPRLERLLSIDRTIDQYEPVPETYEALMWEQTAQRHNQNYYARLQRSIACASFGGYFESPFPKDKALRLSRVQRRLLYELGIETQCISQWDSWRFWESLAAGCATFHLDLHQYGCTLPVMPESWRHYIGIELKHVQEVCDRIAEEPEILERIGAAGQRWAIEHYSPAPTARRFLEIVSPSLLQENYEVVN